MDNSTMIEKLQSNWICDQCRTIKWVLWFFVLITLIIPPLSAIAQTSACSEELFKSSDPNDPLGYKERGDRCEGVYIRPSGSFLQVVSFTQYFESYHLGSSNELIVEWNFPTKKPLFIRAFGIKPDTYYRMDTLVPIGEKHYRWPSNVLEALKIGSGELGVIGWIKIKINKEVKLVHIPLAVRQTTVNAVSKKYEVVFQSASRMNEAYYSLANMDFEGRMIRMIVDGSPLEQGFYPPMQGTRFSIENIPEPGLYLLQITAIQKSGVNSDPVEFWFYLSRDPIN
jgi:hypothetical protein